MLDVRTACLALALVPTPQEPEPAPPEVAVRLVSSHRTLAPDTALEVGVHLAIPPGWHVYWDNPGDTGMRTSVALEAPEGFQVEGPFFPGPTRHEDPGGLVSFVHEGDLVVFFRLRAPDELAPEPVKLRAEVDWLVCQEACFVGSAAPELALGVGSQSVATDGRVAALLGRQRALLPRPVSELPAALEMRWQRLPPEEGSPERFTLLLELEGARDLALFPARDGELTLTAHRFELGKDRGRLAASLERRPTEEAAPALLRGVLRLETDAGVAYFQVESRAQG